MDGLEKALGVEQQLRAALNAYGGAFEDAMLVLMGLAVGSHSTKLGRRRGLAGRLFRSQADSLLTEDTVRRSVEVESLRDLAAILVLQSRADQRSRTRMNDPNCR
jgi:hypothetical protein